MKSKSLTIFLLLIISFVCFIKCTHEKKYHSHSHSHSHKPKPKPKGKAPAKVALKLTPVKKTSVQDKGDFQVCQLGKNLGLVRPDASCVVQFPSMCSESIVRKPDLPPVTKTKRAQIAKKAIINSKRSKNAVKNMKKKFRWTLAGRTARFKKPKLSLRAKKAIKLAKKKLITKKANLRQAKAIARKILTKRSKVRSKSKKGLRKEAKRIAKKVTNSHGRNAARISLGLKKLPKSRAKIMKILKKRIAVKKNLAIGNFCVKSVVWNLSHCCFFKKRKEAQHFANNLPAAHLFEKRLREGKRAYLLDERKKANAQIVGSTKDLKKAKKIIQKRKAAILKGKGKKK